MELNENSYINSNVLVIMAKQRKLAEYISDELGGIPVKIYPANGPTGLDPNTENTYVCVSCLTTESDFLGELSKYIIEKVKENTKSVNIFLYQVVYRIIEKGTYVISNETFDVNTAKQLQDDIIKVVIRFAFTEQ